MPREVNIGGRRALEYEQGEVVPPKGEINDETGRFSIPPVVSTPYLEAVPVKTNMLADEGLDTPGEKAAQEALTRHSRKYVRDWREKPGDEENPEVDGSTPELKSKAPGSFNRPPLITKAEFYALISNKGVFGTAAVIIGAMALRGCT